MNFGDNNRVTIVNIDGSFIIPLTSVFLLAWLGYRGIVYLLWRIEMALDRLTMQAERISDKMNDPVLFPYLIAMAALMAIIGVCFVRLNMRFGIISWIVNFFAEVEDKDFV